MNDPGNPDGGDGGAITQLAYAETNGVLSQLFQYDEQDRVVRALYFTDQGVLRSFSNYSYLGNNRNPSTEQGYLSFAPNFPWFTSSHEPFSATDGFIPTWSFEYEYTDENQFAVINKESKIS